MTCNLGTLANGASATVTLVVSTSASSTGNVVNIATISSATSDTVSSNNTASATTALGCPTVSLSPSSLSLATVGLSFSQTFTLTGGVSPINSSLTGTPPTGLSLSNGTLAGTPTQRGAFALTVTGTDANSCQAAVTYTLAVARELPQMVLGADAGGPASVRTFNLSSTSPAASFVAYSSAFTGGTSVASADTDGDGVLDIVTGAGPGGALRLSFMAYDLAFVNGVEVAVGDLDADGFPEIVTAPGWGSPATVRVFDGRTAALLREFTPSALAALAASSGVHVAVGDLDGDGAAEIIVGGGKFGLPGIQVQVIDGMTGASKRTLTPYDPAFVGGVYVAAGDITGDGAADIITGAGPYGGPHVRIFDGRTGAPIAGPLTSFFAYDPSFLGGVRVAASDLDRDGYADLLTAAGPGGGPHVRVFSGATGAQIYGLLAFDATQARGLHVAAPNRATRMVVDGPQPNATVNGSSVRVAGWVIDQSSFTSSGFDAVHVWAFPFPRGDSPRFVGATVPNVSRPDVANILGGEFLQSGFDLTGTLPAGTYDLVVFAHNARANAFTTWRVIRITVN